MFFLFSKTEEIESDTADANDTFPTIPFLFFGKTPTPAKQNRKELSFDTLYTKKKPKKIEKKRET